MEWDHDEWIRQLRERLTEFGIDDDHFDDETLMFISNLAAKVARGDVSISIANHMMADFVARQMGYADLGSREMFDMEVDVSDLIDVTEGTKDNLILYGQPGIADAMVEVWAHPRVNDESFHEERVGMTAMAVKSKRWFQVTGMHPEEHRLFHQAIKMAVRDHVGTN